MTPALGWALDVSTQSSANPGRFQVFKTVDGAKHWQKQFSGRASSLGFVRFFDKAHGFVAVGDPIDLYRTVDGGAQWEAVSLLDSQITEVAFSDAHDAWAIARSASTPDHNVRLFTSADGGNS